MGMFSPDFPKSSVFAPLGKHPHDGHKTIFGRKHRSKEVDSHFFRPVTTIPASPPRSPNKPKRSKYSRSTPPNSPSKPSQRSHFNFSHPSATVTSGALDKSDVSTKVTLPLNSHRLRKMVLSPSQLVSPLYHQHLCLRSSLKGLSSQLSSNLVSRTRSEPILPPLPLQNEDAQLN